MARTIIDPPTLPAAPPTAVAVAVPACNEAEAIGACLLALDRAAAAAAAHRVTVVVLVNNSRDATAAIATAFRPTACAIVVEVVDLPADEAHAGGARRRALDRAADLLPPCGVLMTTDADSTVDSGWIVANVAELARADAVAGVIAFDEATAAALPPLPLRALEWQLADLHAQLGALLDPRAHDPYPNHIWAWGASLALTLEAYRRIGGLPIVPLAEDRALATAIERHDLRLRHSHAPLVYTSARATGRAPGGFADLLRSYASDTGALCDAALEPTAALVRRLRARARLRAATASGFGATWAAIEGSAFPRTRVAPGELTSEVALAKQLVSALGARRADTRRFASPRLLSPTPPRRESAQPRSPRPADIRASAQANAPA